MEQCELKLRLTPDAMSSRPSVNSSPPFFISIHQVEQSRPLDITKLSRSKLPTRLMNVGNLEIEQGTPVNWSESFDCSWGEVFTFEVSCFELDAKIGPMRECALEFWQRTDHEDFYKSKYDLSLINVSSSDALSDIFMIQHASF